MTTPRVSFAGKDPQDIICLYEELREEVMKPSTLDLPSRGHGLLVQRGLATWAETQSTLLTDSTLKQVKSQPSAMPSIPGELKAQATQILARMALNCLTEYAL